MGDSVDHVLRFFSELACEVIPETCEHELIFLSIVKNSDISINSYF